MSLTSEQIENGLKAIEEIGGVQMLKNLYLASLNLTDEQKARGVPSPITAYAKALGFENKTPVDELMTEANKEKEQWEKDNPGEKYDFKEIEIQRLKEFGKEKERMRQKSITDAIDNSEFLSMVKNSETQTPLLSIVVMFDDANAKKWLEIFLSRLPEISDKNSGLIEVVLSHNVKGDEEKFEYGGVTDMTKGITFKRYQYTYTNWYFDNARNAAKSAATGEWILSLDTDEYIDKFQLSKLVGAIGSADHDIGGINCTVLSHVTKKQGLGIECAPVCRVFRNDPNIQWQSKAHEYVHNSICNENRYAIAESSVVIIHDGYEECTVDGVIAKLNRNYELLCLEVATSQNKAVKEHAKTHSLWTGSEIRKLTGI